MKHTTIACLAAATMLALAEPAPAQEGSPQHADHPMHASGELALNRPEDGGKWASDQSLREGMSRLRAAFESHHAAYQDGHFGSERAEQLAATIEEAVNFMFANCRLPADADAELHKLLAASLAAARSLRRPEEPHGGLHELHQVLRAYPEYFDHPGWKR